MDFGVIYSTFRVRIAGSTGLPGCCKSAFLLFDCLCTFRMQPRLYSYVVFNVSSPHFLAAYQPTALPNAAFSDLRGWSLLNTQRGKCGAMLLSLDVSIWTSPKVLSCPVIILGKNMSFEDIMNTIPPANYWEHGWCNWREKVTPFNILGQSKDLGNTVAWLASGREGGDEIPCLMIWIQRPRGIGLAMRMQSFPWIYALWYLGERKSSCTGYWVCMGNWITSTVSLHECDNLRLTPLFEN